MSLPFYSSVIRKLNDANAQIFPLYLTKKNGQEVNEFTVGSEIWTICCYSQKWLH